MNFTAKTLAAVLPAALWISLSEFGRNEFILKSYWVDHYRSLGLQFPDSPANGAAWGGWSLLYAVSIWIISQKFTFIQTAILSWFYGFVLMWLVIGNMGVLPFRILYYAVPLSLIETAVAALIINKLKSKL